MKKNLVLLFSWNSSFLQHACDVNFRSTANIILYPRNKWHFFPYAELSNVFSSFFGGSEEDPQAETEATPSETTPIDTPTPEDKMEASDGNETTPTDDQEEQPRENEQEEVHYII